MLTLKINNHRIKMPNLASEISLDKGCQIMELVVEKEPTLNSKIAIISLLSKLDVSVIIKHFEEDSINLIYDKIELITPKRVKFYKTFELDKTKYGLIDFDNITVEEWGDIEFWLNQGDTWYTHLADVILIMFRPIKSRKNTLNNVFKNISSRLFFKVLKPLWIKCYKVVPFTQDLYRNKTTFMDKLDFEFGYGVLNYLNEFKSILRKEYPLLYMTDEQFEELKKEEEIEEKQLVFSEIWGYYHLVSEVSENLFERDAWYGKPLREFFKFLSYTKQKNLYELRSNGK